MGTGTMTISQAQDYTDETTFRIGAEYGMPHLGLAVRAGYIYDPTPVPATTLTAQLPDINRNDVTLGASKSLGNYAAHIGLLWVLPGDRKTSDVHVHADLQGLVQRVGVRRLGDAVRSLRSLGSGSISSILRHAPRPEAHGEQRARAARCSRRGRAIAPSGAAAGVADDRRTRTARTRPTRA